MLSLCSLCRPPSNVHRLDVGFHRIFVQTHFSSKPSTACAIHDIVVDFSFFLRNTMDYVYRQAPAMSDEWQELHLNNTMMMNTGDVWWNGVGVQSPDSGYSTCSSYDEDHMDPFSPSVYIHNLDQTLDDEGVVEEVLRLEEERQEQLQQQEPEQPLSPLSKASSSTTCTLTSTPSTPKRSPRTKIPKMGICHHLYHQV